jgi:hypothetical protein
MSGYGTAMSWADRILDFLFTPNAAAVLVVFLWVQFLKAQVKRLRVCATCSGGVERSARRGSQANERRGLWRRVPSFVVLNKGRRDPERGVGSRTTLDLLAQQSEIGSADFLKIDVEDREYGVFQGAQDFLRASPKVCMMFESEADWCQRAGCRQENSFELLRRLRFGLYAWHRGARKYLTTEKALLQSGTLWASRDIARLPV